MHELKDLFANVMKTKILNIVKTSFTNVRKAKDSFGEIKLLVGSVLEIFE